MNISETASVGGNQVDAMRKLVLVPGYDHFAKCSYCGTKIRFVVKDNKLEGVHACYSKALNHRKDD